MFYTLFYLFLSSSLMFFILALKMLTQNMTTVCEISIFHLSSVEIVFIFFFDWMSSLFAAIVFLISGAVALFSEGYMEGDFSHRRFMWMVFAFVLSMMILIFSLNSVSLLLGWDGLGVVSFALILYYNNELAKSASLLTALMNRVGDVAIILAITLLISTGSWNFLLFFSDNKYILLLIILASMTKSAQYPFSAWLPAAMAAPTPVSALVHSSTLVTAGVYLMIRFFPSLTNLDLSLLSCIGILTSVIASISACFEMDFKKIIALSTLSQLGFMFFILSLNQPFLAFFHLISHATLKALLFISAGKVIQENNGNQDLRFLGESMSSLPCTTIFMNLSILSLGGLPFLSGFYSKDSALELIMSGQFSFSTLLSIFFMVAMSTLYSMRMLTLSMISCFNSPSLVHMKKESDTLLASLLMTGGCALSSGSFLSWIIFNSPLNLFLSLPLKMMAFLASLTGILLGLVISIFTLTPKKMTTLSLASLSHLSLFSGVFPMKFSKISKEMASKDQGWFEFISGGSFFNLAINWAVINPVNLFYKMFISMIFILPLTAVIFMF